MIEMKGKYNEAKIFTDVVDSASIAQVQELCNQEFTAGSRIRLMPDIHAGAGCTIGTTMTITDKVVPNLVGVDIGWLSFTFTSFVSSSRTKSVVTAEIFLRQRSSYSSSGCPVTFIFSIF